MGIKTDLETSGALTVVAAYKSQLVRVTKEVSDLVALCGQLARLPIAGAEHHLEAGQALQQATKLAKLLDDERAAAKRPYLDGGREIDQLGKTLAGPLQDSKEQLALKMADYELQRDLRNAAAEPDKNGVTVLDAEGGTPYTRTVKSLELWIIHPGLVPAKFLKPDMGAIEAAFKAGELPPAEGFGWLGVKRKYRVQSR